jgi:hypothetical protein
MFVPFCDSNKTVSNPSNLFSRGISILTLVNLKPLFSVEDTHFVKKIFEKMKNEKNILLFVAIKANKNED